MRKLDRLCHRPHDRDYHILIMQDYHRNGLPESPSFDNHEYLISGGFNNHLLPNHQVRLHNDNHVRLPAPESIFIPELITPAAPPSPPQQSQQAQQSSFQPQLQHTQPTKSSRNQF